ncbi:hypothetical protein KM043_014689 [Ampulex compressa]|nr:hypothetical protein KM043_014689 [Ampulex compressa]
MIRESGDNCLCGGATGGPCRRRRTENGEPSDILLLFRPGRGDAALECEPGGRRASSIRMERPCRDETAKNGHNERERAIRGKKGLKTGWKKGWKKFGGHWRTAGKTRR